MKTDKSIKIDVDSYIRIKDIADAEGRTIKFLIKKAVELLVRKGDR